MRATKAPPRGPINAQVRAGDALFRQVGCGGCHIPTIRTAAPGTRINGGALRVRDAVGNKIIHPYSDFLLHDIGTGDGIPVLPGAEFASTATQIRTVPLWAIAHAQSADARRPVVHQAGSDRAARGPGDGGEECLQRTEPGTEGPGAGSSSTRFEPERGTLECEGGLAGQWNGPRSAVLGDLSQS